MKIMAFLSSLVIAFLYSATAEARSYHHHTHHQQYVHPMVKGLGIGLVYMLRASQKHEAQVPAGPSSMPTYNYGADTYTPSKAAPVKVHEQWADTRHSQIRYSRARKFDGLDASCRSAARQGGPCGCWAQEHFFGSSVRLFNGMNLWLAREWLRFPHTSPAAGTAAVWPNGHHVAPVVAVNGDGTVTVADSWGTHAVRMARLTFVRPNGGRYATAY